MIGISKYVTVGGGQCSLVVVLITSSTRKGGVPKMGEFLSTLQYGV